MQRHDEYSLSLRDLIQAGLVFVDRGDDCVVMPLAFEAVIPEVFNRESILLRSGSSTKAPRGVHQLSNLPAPNTPIPISAMK
ncbi:hypothetical protein CXF79_14705 [Colwellia sp. Bg11-28]|nr:hypothetical protein CXF79_14705 [Colwellia sp. Bg11-28]